MSMNPFNMKELMEKAKKMQQQMQKAQDQMKSITVIGTAGANLIKAHVNGLHQVLRVEISPTLMNEEDKDMLEDLIAAAFNDAAKKIEATIKQKIGELTKDLELPEDFDN